MPVLSRLARRAWLWVALGGCLVGVLSVTGAGQARAAASAVSAAPAAASVPRVTHLAVRSVTPSALTLTWRWPAGKSVTRAVVRMAVGNTAPSKPTAGRGVGTIKRPRGKLRVKHLSAHTRYAFAVFARNSSGHYAKARTISVTTRPRPLRITTGALPKGTRGLFYVAQLIATGGVTPYHWSAKGLPRGLSISSAGAVTGYPRTTGAKTVTFRVRDARKKVLTRKLRLKVPGSLPSGCVARNCAQLRRNTHTIHVRAKDVVSVARSKATGKVATVVVSHVSVVKGDVLVLPPDSVIPSGVIVGVNSVAKTAGGELTLKVKEATPAAAYYQGTVQSVVPAKSPAPARPRTVIPGKAAALRCGGSVIAKVHGLTVRPSLTAKLGLQWRHNLFGRKGIYVGWGGLKLFSVSLTGKVRVDMGASVSGKATCTLDLPKIYDTLPAGDLGVVLLSYAPSLTLKVSGAIAVDTSVTLTCTADDTWYKGRQSRTDYCTAAHSSLHLTAKTGLNATLTGRIKVSASLDDLPGIQGSIHDSLHLGYHPTQTPVGELDTSSGYDLKATLANIWKGAPKLTIAKGEFFHAVLATWGSAPPGDNGRPRISVSPSPPSKAWVWNDATCGWDSPNAHFTVSGKGFKPGEKVTIVTGWKTYPQKVTANWEGSFSVTEFVGAVRSVLNETFFVDAKGSAGSLAGSEIELDSSGCLYPRDSGGTVTLRWGASGADPHSGVYLYINGALQASATTGGGGSGGGVTSFACPAAGYYSWGMDWTVNGGPVHAIPQSPTVYCTPASSAATRRVPAHAHATGAAAASRGARTSLTRRP